MAEFYSKEAVVEFIRSYRHSTDVAFHMEEHLYEIPAADVVERKRGKWIYQFHEDEVGVTCSECEGYAESFARWIYDEGYRVTHNYCPNCGADMMEES